MDRTRLMAELASAEIGAEEIVYIDRSGEDYRWRSLEPGAVSVPSARPDGTEPDAWIFYSGRWPSRGPGERDAFLDDLLAEMDSMTGGADRCRWPLDQPYQHWH
jgi:hypothetical protein